MLKAKFKKITVIMLCMIMMLSLTSIAADLTCKVSLLGNKKEVKKGESVTILVKATEIQAGAGIVSFNAVLEYDSDVFDCNVSGDDDGVWQKQGLIENSLTMARADLEANSSDQTIAKIVLTAKSNASIGTQTFKLSKMDFTTGDQTFSVADVSANISIIEESGGNNNNNTNTNNSNSSGNNNNNTNNNSNTNNNASGNSTNKNNSSSGSNINKNSSSGGSGVNTIQKNSSSDSNLPKTGITDFLFIGIAIGVVVAIVSYIKYRRAY